jgi:hypothetical protein
MGDSKHETPPARSRGCFVLVVLVSVAVVMTGVLVLVVAYFLDNRGLGG